MFRKILTVLIFVVFILASIPFFLGLTLRQTFLRPTFYEGTLLNTAYTPFVDFGAKNIRDIDPVFQKYFSQDEIGALLEKYLTKDIFSQIVFDTVRRFYNLTQTTSDSDDTRKMKLVVNYQPLVEPVRLLIGELVQFGLDRIPSCTAGVLPSAKDIFPDCMPAAWQNPEFKAKFKQDFDMVYQKKIFNDMASNDSNKAFISMIPLGVSQRDVSYIMSQFQHMGLYMVVFMLTFALLMLLLWLRHLQIGLRYVGIMWMSAAVLGLLLALVVSKADLFFGSDISQVASTSANMSVSLKDIIHILGVAFAKVYAEISFFFLLIGTGVYLFANHLANRYSKS